MSLLVSIPPPPFPSQPKPCTDDDCYYYQRDSGTGVPSTSRKHQPWSTEGTRWNIYEVRHPAVAHCVCVCVGRGGGSVTVSELTHEVDSSKMYPDEARVQQLSAKEHESYLAVGTVATDAQLPVAV